MTKLVLTEVGSTLTNTAATQINANNDAIIAAVENTLSRDGSTPNQMNADIDMDGNDLMNVGRMDAESLFINGEGVQSVTIATALKISNNLSDVDNVAASRANLGLTDTATTVSTAFGKSLIDDVDAASALSTLGVSAFSQTLLDDSSATAWRGTLGLGSVATTNTTDYATAAQGVKADSALQPAAIGSSVQAFRLVGSATFDPPSLADGAGTSTTVTVTGAALGDFAIPSFSLDLQGITVTAYVSSANTCTVRFQNESGGVLDLASGTLRVAVFK